MPSRSSVVPLNVSDFRTGLKTSVSELIESDGRCVSSTIVSNPSTSTSTTADVDMRGLVIEDYGVRVIESQRQQEPLLLSLLLIQPFMTDR